MNDLKKAILEMERCAHEWEWGFFRGLFTHLGFEPSSVMVVSKGEYDRVAGSCARKGR